MCSYHGNKSATDKKILKDVFKKGDMYEQRADVVVAVRGFGAVAVRGCDVPCG